MRAIATEPSAFSLHEQGQDAIKRGDFTRAVELFRQAASRALTPEGRRVLEDKAASIEKMTEQELERMRV